MANTSRKRPPPEPTTNGSNTSEPSTSTIPLPAGIDQLLAKYVRHIPPGGSIQIQLVKGPTSSSVDPIAARRAAAKAARRALDNNNEGGGDNDNATEVAGAGKGIHVPLNFPRIAKFSETVTSPNFNEGGKLKDGRMYEEEVPKAKDESDEDESTAYQPSTDMGGGDPTISEASTKNKKKKRRWRRNDPRPRRWVLQEKAEFFDRIRKRKQRGSAGTGGDDDDEQGISNQYHGVVESNASKYVILSVAPPSSSTTTTDTASASTLPTTKVATEQISIQPIHGFHTFSQPYKFSSLTMEEAESAIEDQRNVMTRYMMHGKLASNNSSHESKAALASGVAAVGVGRGSRALNRPIGPAPKAMSRARLLGKLAGGGGGLGEDDDDVMSDVRYSSSKGSGRARKELLTSMGDGVTADDDGVLGGANDSEFGGRRRFGRVNANKDDGETSGKKGAKGDSAKTSTGFEAGAMEEGFYQRDVAAEYEALDYDANEQFDDDDVNVGEDEMMDDGGGYGGDFQDSGDDNMLDSEDEDGSDDDGFKGMATSSGLKAMLAKARGDSPVTTRPASPQVAGTDKTPDNSSGANGGSNEFNHVLGAAEKIAEEREKKISSTTSTPEDKKPSPLAAPAAPLVDEDGSDDDGFKGMATSSGLKAMLAKARGDSPVTTRPASPQVAGTDKTPDNSSGANGGSTEFNHVLGAAEKIAEEREKKISSTTSTPEDKKPSPLAAPAAPLVDKDGKRLITLEAVRREIWLNNGAITSKRLTKKFDVTKKNPERQALFKTIVMELCTIKKDADGNKLVLKQHYAKI